MKLVIVESPTKAKTLSRYLGEGFNIIASMGHIRDLPKSELGVDVEHDFKPSFVLVPKKGEVVTNLREAAKKASQIILATDPDREGEAIAYHIAWILKDSTHDKVLRIVFHEITKTAIDQALQHPGKINHKLVDSQTARRILDRLVGYKVSPILWRKVRRGLSAGRVQSPAVRLIVEREREIKAFKPEEYWKIEVELQKRGIASSNFKASLYQYQDKKIEVKTKTQADKVVADLKKADYLVYQLDKVELRKNPPPPYITSTLQRAASSIFRWSAKKTMQIAQHLYEKGLITYHRTDSVNMAAEAVSKARVYIEKTFGKEYLPEKPRFYKTKSKLAQEAHEAIRPTRLNPTLGETKMDYQHEQLYKLIFNRFVGCQMAESLVERNIVDIKAQDYLVRAVGELLKFAGWRVVWGKAKSEDQDVILPALAINEKLKLLQVLSEQKFTEPASRYTEGTLIKALEERGIGRPSTYAPIISTIQVRQYVLKNQGFFEPTSVGEAVIDFLLKYFFQVVDYDFTAQMEDDLDKIAQGEKQHLTVLHQFYTPFAKKLAQVEKTAQRVKIQVEKTGLKCPECKTGDQIVRIGRFGKFLACSRFPKCYWKAVYLQKVKDLKCPQCSGEVVIRRTKKGKQFFGCVNWPSCKWAAWKKPISKTNKSKKTTA